MAGSAFPRYGQLEEDFVLPFPIGETLETLTATMPDDAIHLATVRLLPPVTPSKIVCVGRNYLEHAAELGNKMPEEPLLFLKAPSSIIGHGDEIRLPTQSLQVEHEGELGVIIGQKAGRMARDEDPLNYVLGYTCVNDVTARDLQRKDVQFTRAKSFDTFCPVGPIVVDNVDPTNVLVTTRVNGEIKQRGCTAEMAFPVPFLIRYIADVMTLYPGDLVATGTPAGVSRLNHGDRVEIEIDGIGVLGNPVVAAK